MGRHRVGDIHVPVTDVMLDGRYHCPRAMAAPIVEQTVELKKTFLLFDKDDFDTITTERLGTGTWLLRRNEAEVKLRDMGIKAA